MKTSITRTSAMLIMFIALLTISSNSIFAQSPLKMSYQAVVRNSSNLLVANQAVGMQISILQNSNTGTAVYVETINTSTNANGLVTVEIGTGTVITGNLAGIDWSKGTYFIKTETDPTGGTNYSITGVTQLLSVPYALLSNLSVKSLNDLDTSATNELQQLKIVNDTLYLDRGGNVYLGGFSDKSELQNLKNIINTDHLIEASTNNAIYQKIMADSSYLKSLINKNTSDISNEIIDRTTGFYNLNTKERADSSYLRWMINGEITNRTNNDNSIKTNLNNLNAKVDSDSGYFATNDNSLANNLNTEVSDRTNADNTLQTNITSEKNARILGDNTLKTKVIADSTYLKGLIIAVNIGTEIADRCLAAVQADTGVAEGQSLFRLFQAKAFGEGEHVPRAGNGPGGVIGLVRGCAEQGHDAVAGKVHHQATMRHHHVADAVQVGVQRRQHHGGIGGFG